MKKNFIHKLCGFALAGLFTISGMVAIPSIFQTTAVMAEPTPNLTSVNHTFYYITTYYIGGSRKGNYGWTELYATPDAVDDVIARCVKGDAEEGDIGIILDVNQEFENDSVWYKRYDHTVKGSGAISITPYTYYYNDMLASYPQLKKQIKNGWRDLSYTGIQKLIASGVLPADCLVGRYSKAGTATTDTTATTTTTSTTADASTDNNIKKLQAAVVELTVHPATVYNGVDYSKEFNAAYYYIANPDLQSAIGINAQALLQHYVMFGKKEGRLSIAK